MTQIEHEEKVKLAANVMLMMTERFRHRSRYLQGYCDALEEIVESSDDLPLMLREMRSALEEAASRSMPLRYSTGFSDAIGCMLEFLENPGGMLVIDPTAGLQEL